MVLGVASLIVVLSVMNGFAGELRGRILSLVPHGYVESDSGLAEWPAVAATLEREPGIVAVAPYITEKVLLRSRIFQGIGSQYKKQPIRRGTSL